MQATLECSYCGQPIQIEVSDENEAQYIRTHTAWCDNPECCAKADIDGLLDVGGDSEDYWTDRLER